MTATAVAEAPSEIEFVTFSVAEQLYCLEITQIQEIRRWSPVAKLPHSPADILGVMNLRGAVIPIYDLAAKFGLGMTEQCERSVVIVSSIDSTPVGLLVDSVSEIVTIKSEDVQDAPDVASEATKECISGVVALDDTMVRALNLNSIIKPGQ